MFPIILFIAHDKKNLQLNSPNKNLALRNGRSNKNVRETKKKKMISGEHSKDKEERKDLWI